jgi:hypothetical protein
MIANTGSVIVEDAHSAVSWKAILAGSTAAIAVTMILVAFGLGVGFSVISPWSDQGVSSTTFTVAAGIYLIVVAMLANTIGGYIAGRLRTQWQTVNEHERYFRDSAHGFLVWALATVVSAGVLGGAFTHILAGSAAGVAPAAATAAQGSPADVYVDTLLRTDPTQGSQNATPAQANQQATSPTAEGQTASPLQGGQIAPQRGPTNVNRAEITRILVPAVAKGGTLSTDNRAYLVKVVSARSGLPQADAEKRVDQVVTQAKTAADKARKSAAMFSLWLAASMLAGGLAGILAAIEGGVLRNREWYLDDTTAPRNRVVAAE